jgi:multidrug resistance efflux pump
MDTLTTPETVDNTHQIEQENELYQPKRHKKPPNKKRRKLITRIIWITVLIAFLGGVAFGVWQLFFQPKPVFYETQFIYRGMLENTAMGWGTVRPAAAADILVTQSGTVLETYFFEGDRVEQGDVLFLMDSEAIDKAIRDLQMQLDNLEKQKRDILEAQGKAYSQSTITAPFSGKLVDVTTANVGDPASAFSAKIIDDSTLLLTLYYSYAYEPYIAKGQRAQIAIPASMTLIEGTVNRVEKVRRITPDGLVSFEVEFAVRNPGALVAGMTATAIMYTPSGEDMLPMGAMETDDSGVLRNSREQSISAEVHGNITYFNMRNYQSVSAGTVLCRIDYTFDGSMLQRIEEDIAKVLEDIAKQEELYESLRRTAPISGTVMYNRLIVGERPDPTQPVMSIAQLDKMIIEAQIDERNIGGVSPGQSAMLEIWTYDGMQMFWGTVESVSFEAKQDFSYIYFPAVISAENFSGMLLSGMGVNYAITTDSRWDILVAPVNAVKMTPVGVVVFVKTDVRPAHAVDMPPEVPMPEGFYAVPVTVGLGTAFGVEITSGVEEGWEVFTQELDYDPNEMGGMDGGFGGRGGIRVG